jgi:hypothetical protein
MSRRLARVGRGPLPVEADGPHSDVVEVAVVPRTQFADIRECLARFIGGLQYRSSSFGLAGLQRGGGLTDATWSQDFEVRACERGV